LSRSSIEILRLIRPREKVEPTVDVAVAKTLKTKRSTLAPQPSTPVRASTASPASTTTTTKSTAGGAGEKTPALLKNAPTYVQATWVSDFQPALYEVMFCSTNPFTLVDDAKGMDFTRYVQSVFNRVHPGRILTVGVKDPIYLTVRRTRDSR
jgi:hypothetical protein